MDWTEHVCVVTGAGTGTGIGLGIAGVFTEKGYLVVFNEVSYVTGTTLLADGDMTSPLINRKRYTSQTLEGQYKS